MGQRRLCQQVGIRPSTRPLLSGSVEGLSQGRKYLKTIISRSAPKKLISSFHKDHPEKPIAISPPINSVLPMARPIDKPTTKRKQGRPVKSASKQAKNWIKLAYVSVKSFLSKTSSQIARIPRESYFQLF